MNTLEEDFLRSISL